MEAIHFSSNTDLNSVRRAHPGVSLSQLYALDREQRLGREQKELNANTTSARSTGWLVTLASVALDAAGVVIEVPVAKPLNGELTIKWQLSKKERPVTLPRSVGLCPSQLALLDSSTSRQIGVLTKAEKTGNQDGTAALRLLGTVWRETEIRQKLTDPVDRMDEPATP